MPVRKIALALATVAMLLAVGTQVGAAKLNTSDLLGTWVGSWQDATLHTNGPAVMIVLPFGAGNRGLHFSFHFGGSFFGCGEFGPEDAYIFPGHSGQSTVTPHKITANSDDGTFGRYHFKTQGAMFQMRGKKTCNGAGPPSYRAKGALAGDTITAEFKLKVDGGMDVVTFSLRRVAGAG